MLLSNARARPSRPTTPSAPRRHDRFGSPVRRRYSPRRAKLRANRADNAWPVVIAEEKQMWLDPQINVKSVDVVSFSICAGPDSVPETAQPRCRQGARPSR